MILFASEHQFCRIFQLTNWNMVKPVNPPNPILSNLSCFIHPRPCFPLVTHFIHFSPFWSILTQFVHIAFPASSKGRPLLKKQLFLSRTESSRQRGAALWSVAAIVTKDEGSDISLIEVNKRAEMEENGGTGGERAEEEEEGQHAGLDWEGLLRSYQEGLVPTPTDWGKPLLTELPWEDVLFEILLPCLQVNLP